MATSLGRKLRLAARLWGKIVFSNQLKHWNTQLYCSGVTKDIRGVMLNNRAHIHVYGEDYVKFLQGLLTNDVTLFHSDKHMNVMYSMMLNSRGRLLYDLMMYKYNDGILIESDSKAVNSILKTFQLYKLRSRVAFNDLSEIFNCYAIISEGNIKGPVEMCGDQDGVILVEDPRTSLLGFRLLLPKSKDINKYFHDEIKIQDQMIYDRHRVSLGVCEGINDIEPGRALPLEYNIIEMYGVSFHKGCYVGQELTARTYHTGVVRKRLMPFHVRDMSFVDHHLIKKGMTIMTLKGQTAGKVISSYGDIGLALIRVKEVQSSNDFLLSLSEERTFHISIEKPIWLE